MVPIALHHIRLGLYYGAGAFAVFFTCLWPLVQVPLTHTCYKSALGTKRPLQRFYRATLCQDSRTLLHHLRNSGKIKRILAWELQVFHPHIIPWNPQKLHLICIKGNLEESFLISFKALTFFFFLIHSESQCWGNSRVFDQSFFCLFPSSSPIRGLFASHFTETHYREDGSAVTSAHNITVSWLTSHFDTRGQSQGALVHSSHAAKSDI